MLNNEIKDFTFHEFKTDSDNFVKDISKLLSLGCYSDKVLDKDGVEIKPASASIEYNWQIVYPAPNYDLIGLAVTDVEHLSPEDYETITLDQISRITNKATVRGKTLSTDKTALVSAMSTQMGEVSKTNAEIYLQLYMPKFLCDTETDDPFVQEDGVNIPLCINPKNGKKEAKVRNYHWCLTRLFDKPNADFSGPLDNKTDLVTGELLEFNSASSEWSKISWFTDFEEKFLSDIVPGTSSVNDKVLRVPVNSSLTNKTKIRIMANIHPNRVALTVVGNPNVDYSDNRYLISTAYIGAIDSFEGSKVDVEGNFGLFTSSSSIPSIPSQTIEPTSTFSGLDDDGSGAKIPTDQAWKVYNQTPTKVVVTNSPEQQIKGFINLGTLSNLNIDSIDPNTKKMPGTQTFKTTYKKREIPANPLVDSEGGRTGIVKNSIKTTIGNVSDAGVLSFQAMFEWGNSILGSGENNQVLVNIPTSDLKMSMLPIVTTLDSKDGSLIETIDVTIDNDSLYKVIYKYLEVELATKGALAALAPKLYNTQTIRFSGLKYHLVGGLYTTLRIAPIGCQVGFDEQGAIRKVVNKSLRDKYGNLIAVNYPKTFGKHTANCTTDFAMYKTDSADFWQSHFLMFSSTEQFMKKHMYGKSVYTNEYFADRIKVTHSAEGVRGVLSGLIVIDAESLFAFDELIVNKDFNKDLDKPEETYIYLPITAAYCPFANSPNERNGIGLLKELRYSEHDDEAKCEAALVKIAEQYIDSLYCTNDKEEVGLADKAYNGLNVTWTTSDSNIITIGNPA